MVTKDKLFVSLLVGLKTNAQTLRRIRSELIATADSLLPAINGSDERIEQAEQFIDRVVDEQRK